MDDEEMLRKLAKEMLKRLSYRVEAVTDGSAAIDIYNRSLRDNLP
jgi:CheY-like chemotaxis protein